MRGANNMSGGVLRLVVLALVALFPFAVAAASPSSVRIAGTDGRVAFGSRDEAPGDTASLVRTNANELTVEAKLMVDDGAGAPVDVGAGIRAVAAAEGVPAAAKPHTSTTPPAPVWSSSRVWPHQPAPSQSFSRPSPTASDLFGSCVAVDGNTLVVGARTAEEAGANTDHGMAYVYWRAHRNSPWTEQATLSPSGRFAHTTMQFGYSCAVHDLTIAVGAPYADATVVNSGEVYVYTHASHESTTWTEQTILRASVPAVRQFAIKSVRVYANVIAVGANHDSTTQSQSGAVYVFGRNAATGVWTELAKLKEAVPVALIHWGQSVDLHADRLVVGCNKCVDSQGHAGGTVTVYTIDTAAGNAAPVLEQVLETAELNAGWHLGITCAVWGDTIVAGGHRAVGDRGIVVVWRIAPSVAGGTPTEPWVETQLLAPSDSQGGQRFGGQVRVRGRTVAVATSGLLAAGGGRVYVFTEDSDDGNVFTQRAIVSLNTELAFTGILSLSEDGNDLLVGADLDDTHAADAGAAHAFRTRVQYHRTSAPLLVAGGGDDVAVTPFLTSPSTVYFARLATSVSGDVLVAGQTHETVGGLANAGQVRVYSRTAAAPTSWTLAATLHPAAPVAQARFGDRLTLRGRVLVVAAPYRATNTGAVYVFERMAAAGDDVSAAAWTEHPVIVAPVGGTNKYFGLDVALSSDGLTLVAGQKASTVDGVANAGNAFVFRRTPAATTWTHVATLRAGVAMASQGFGRHLAIDDVGDTIVVGGEFADFVVHVFVRKQSGGDPDAWTLQTTLRLPHVSAVHSVALNARGTMLVVGQGEAQMHDVASAGAVHVFARSVGRAHWQLTQTLTAETHETATAKYGFVVALRDDTLVVSAPTSDGDNGGSEDLSGRLYVYSYLGGVWSLQARVRASSSVGNLEFGSAMSFDGAHIVCGTGGVNQDAYVVRLSSDVDATALTVLSERVAQTRAVAEREAIERAE